MKKLLALVLALSLTLSLAGCGEGSTPVKGDPFRLDVCFASEPATIDPALNVTADGGVLLHHLFEGLVKWMDDGKGNAKLVPGVAESWDISDDGRVYTFHLREDARWSDGEPVTAQDFEYAWRRVVDPATGSAYSMLFDCIVNGGEILAGDMEPDQLGIAVVDEQTFEVSLHTAIPHFIEIVAFPVSFPVRQGMIEEHEDQWTFDPATYVSNGPYHMIEWVHNAYIEMEKNPNHYDLASLGPDQIRFALMDDENAMLAAYRSGELDFNAGVPVDEVPALLESGELSVGENIGTYFVSFHAGKEPFDDPRIREAFSLAIDRNFIVEQISRAGELPAGGYIPPTISDVKGGDKNFREVGGDFYSLSKDDYAANTQRARDLLEVAGYPNGSGFPTVEYIYNNGDSHRAIAEGLQNMWQQELGIPVRISNMEWNAFMQTRINGDYTIARNGWFSDFDDPISFLDVFVSDGGNNDAFYSNAAYDQQVQKAKTSQDPQERMAAMHEAEEILMGDSVVAPLYFYTQPFMISDDLDGWYYSPLGLFFFGYTTRVDEAG